MYVSDVDKRAKVDKCANMPIDKHTNNLIYKRLSTVSARIPDLLEYLFATETVKYFEVAIDKARQLKRIHEFLRCINDNKQDKHK